MEDVFTIEALLNLGVLLFLQAVLGFDNLLYISIESQRAPADQQSWVRKTGILIAIALRIILLFVMVQLIAMLEEPFYFFNWEGVITGGVNFSTIVFVIGGAFIIYTAVKEIKHLLEIEDPEHAEQRTPKSAMSVIALIVFMNLIFSFDSILSALAITDVFAVLAAAILISGAGMYFLADQVSNFIKKNRKYEVLGLFILLIVGVVLLGEAGHAAEPYLHLFGYPVEPMSKTTFYFSVVVLVAVDIIQSGYEKKLKATRAKEKEKAVAAARPVPGE